MNQPTHYDYTFEGKRLDPYRILLCYGISHPAQQHAIKKLLRAGRSIKPLIQDIDEVIMTLNRWREMILEEPPAEYCTPKIPWGESLSEEFDVDFTVQQFGGVQGWVSMIIADKSFSNAYANYLRMAGAAQHTSWRIIKSFRRHPDGPREIMVIQVYNPKAEESKAQCSDTKCDVCGSLLVLPDGSCGSDECRRIRVHTIERTRDNVFWEFDCRVRTTLDQAMKIAKESSKGEIQYRVKR